MANHEPNTPYFLTVEGAPALSGFRRAKLAGELRELGVEAARIEARFVHAAEFAAPPSDDEMRRLAALLGLEGGARPFDAAAEPDLFVVSPRPGTISPWSSKATDIAHLCGLGSLNRIERAVSWRIAGFAPERREAVAALLHDRMTEAVLPDAAALRALF